MSEAKIKTIDPASAPLTHVLTAEGQVAMVAASRVLAEWADQAMVVWPGTTGAQAEIQRIISLLDQRSREHRKQALNYSDSRDWSMADRADECRTRAAECDAIAELLSRELAE